MDHVIGHEQFDMIEAVLKEELLELGVDAVALIDMAGNVICGLDNGRRNQDFFSLAALAAGNFGAMSEMAKMIGEEEFTLFFHKGESVSIDFSLVMSDFLLLTIFGHEITLGMLRMKVAASVAKIEKILGT